jgi:hypothetical protein
MSKEMEAKLQTAIKAHAPKPVPKKRAAKGTPIAKAKAVNMYMHPADMDRIRTLSSFINTRGRRASDSRVVKAALNAVRINDDLLNAYDAVVAKDQRLKSTKV